jgi:predicted GIY-YIG superfamily endonuclease
MGREREMNEQETERACDLYRWFDKDDNLLYVGISFNAYNRAKGHKQEAEWWADATMMTIEKFANRELAYEAEIRAIQTENPKHNKQRYFKWTKKLAPVSLVDIFNKAIADGLTKEQMDEIIGQATEIYLQLKLADINA